MQMSWIAPFMSGNRGWRLSFARWGVEWKHVGDGVLMFHRSATSARPVNGQMVDTAAVPAKTLCSNHQSIKPRGWQWFEDNKRKLAADPDVSATYTIDGTVVRMYLGKDGRWKTATNKMHDASLASFGGRDFHSLFLESGGDRVMGEVARRDPAGKRTWVFTFAHPHQRNVHKHERAEMLVLGSIVNATGEEMPPEAALGRCPEPVDIASVAPGDRTARGILLAWKSTGARVRVDYPDFAEAEGLRAGYESVETAFAAALGAKDPSPFFARFPDHAEKFGCMVKAYDDLASFVAVMASIRARGVTVPPERKVLKELVEAVVVDGGDPRKTLESAYAALRMVQRPLNVVL